MKKEKKYFVQIKGIKDNKNCWETKVVFYTLKEALKNYNFYKSGCCKRILRETIITKVKQIRYRKY